MYCVQCCVKYITYCVGEWTTPGTVGERVPPTSDFVIESITKNKAIIYGGLIHKGFDTTDSVYIIDIRNKTIVRYTSY